MPEETEGTVENQKADKPWLFKKGQSGNPKGRPKGPSLKEWSREYLAAMTDEERLEFMDGLPKEIIWKMGEGNPANNTDITSAGRPIIAIAAEIVDKNALNTSTD